jgi:hypothetical protein
MSQWSHRTIDTGSGSPKFDARFAIDTHGAPVLAHGGGDEERLMSLADHMGTCKPLMEMGFQALSGENFR